MTPRRAGALLVLAVAVAVAPWVPGPALVGRLYLLAVAAVGLAGLARRVGAVAPSAAPLPSAGRVSEVDGTPPARPASLTDLERLLDWGRTAGGVHFHLRPVLREIAAHRLEACHGVDLDADPPSARRLLGDPTYELVRPDREPPADRLASGPPLVVIREIIDALEAIR